MKVEKMIVTTAGRTDKKMIEKAKLIAAELLLRYIPRNKQSVKRLHDLYSCDCLIVGKERLELVPFASDQAFFFHPNSASFRIKRLKRGDKDPFIDACQLSTGMSILDCTMGLASDSIVASFIVGNTGKVIAIEANPYLHYIVKNGLTQWRSEIEEMNHAMRRIETNHADHLEFLKGLPDHYVDIVYFDPMFEDAILSSDGISGLRQFASYSSLNEGLISEAKRVAKKRIILKDHFRSPNFQMYGFHVNIRKSAKFHYGVIELETK